jgi:hypothetical protein
LTTKNGESTFCHLFPDQVGRQGGLGGEPISSTSMWIFVKKQLLAPPFYGKKLKKGRKEDQTSKIEKKAYLRVPTGLVSFGRGKGLCN